MSGDGLPEVLLAQNIAFVERNAPATPEELAGLREDAEQNAVRCRHIARIVGGTFTPAARPRVLEVGIGYAYLTTALRRLLGDEFDLYAVELPERRFLDLPEFRRLVAEQRVELALCDVLHDRLPWPGVGFDAIVFADVIEHLPPTEVPAVLARLRERLSRSGRLILTSTNLPAVYRMASLAFGNGLILDPAFPLEVAPGAFGHIRLYGRADMEILLERTGLRLVEFAYGNWEIQHVPRVTRSQRLTYAAQRALPSMVERWSTSWLLSATHA